MLDDLTGATATLTVTDEQGLTDDATISLDPGAQAVKTRQLAIAAAGDGLVYLADGSTTPLIFDRSRAGLRGSAEHLCGIADGRLG